MSRKRDWSRVSWENLPNPRFYEPQFIPDAHPEIEKRDLEDMEAVARFRRANGLLPSRVDRRPLWQRRFHVGMTVRHARFGFGVVKEFTDTDMAVFFPRLRRIEWIDKKDVSKLQT